MKLKDSKFYKPPTLKERLTNLKYAILFWKGRPKGMIHTANIRWKDIRVIFFPLTFSEKYSYLGAVPWKEDDSLFKALEPLVIFMDHRAKPKYCPRWFLRFLNLFGNDNSIVRVRNRKLHDLFNYLTQGYRFIDYKTKWEWYDLRITVYGDHTTQNLADMIESSYYDRGYRKDLAKEIKRLDPDTTYTAGYSADLLKKELDRLENKVK